MKIAGADKATSFPRQSATAINLSLVGAGRARDEDATNLQSVCKGRGHGPLLRNIDGLNLMTVALWRGNDSKVLNVMAGANALTRTFQLSMT